MTRSRRRHWRPRDSGTLGDASLHSRARSISCPMQMDRGPASSSGCSGGGLRVGGIRLQPGLAIERMEGIDRTRRIDCRQLRRRPLSSSCLAAPKIARRVLDAGLVLLAADAHGGGMACVDASVEYAKTREQFGVKIGSFQALEASARGHGGGDPSHAGSRLVRRARLRPPPGGGVGGGCECEGASDRSLRRHRSTQRSKPTAASGTRGNATSSSGSSDRSSTGRCWASLNLHRRRVADLLGW